MAAPHSAPVRLDAQLGDDDYRAIGEFRRALREFLAFSDRAATEQGVTSQQHQALLAIRGFRGPEQMTVGDLADCLLIRNHTAVELVGRLVTRGLVTRQASDEDRRRVLLALTDEGRRVLEAISLRNLGEYQRTGRELTEVLRLVKRLQAQAQKSGSVPSS